MVHMARSIAITTFKARCLGLIDEVQRTGRPLVITKRGRPVARLVAHLAEGVAHPQLGLRGSVEILGDIVSPALPASDWEAMCEAE